MESTLSFKHLISAHQLSKHDINFLCKNALLIKQNKLKISQHYQSPKILASLFFEPSTRTRFSFESAILKLGGNYINLENSNLEFSFILISQIIILLSFLLFNFPTAKIFLGDGGAYLLGSLIALNVITTNNLYPNISSFFFCTLLFYLFFEVFFSFFRKLFNGKSPFYPDDSHLHMLSFYKISKVFGKEKSNFLNSIIINFSFLILILPGIYFSENAYLSRYWFFMLLLIYIIIYFRLFRLTKN